MSRNEKCRLPVWKTGKRRKDNRCMITHAAEYQNSACLSTEVSHG